MFPFILEFVLVFGTVVLVSSTKKMSQSTTYLTQLKDQLSPGALSIPPIG